MGLNEEAFDVLYKDLCEFDSTYVGRDVILCPICWREIPKADVITTGIEHIIPRNVVANDSSAAAELATKNQRCGITVLCRQPRTINGKEVKDGCNGFKGSAYDRLFRHLFDDKDHTEVELRHRHGVAILIMAYLGAFQTFGYSYIRRNELDEIREQFDFPDDRKTGWLECAMFSLRPLANPIVATEVGQPFVVGGLMNEDTPLHVLFRRCQAYLPHGHWNSTGVESLNTLLPKYP
ncbi:hypothetical protein [uncultured Rubinisphaera sp.]|uniref:hypothetical protein n=1 Tax=uncultured Rubinisphaera sp. TaxID=1678686 RepID=UPI0030DD7E0E